MGETGSDIGYEKDAGSVAEASDPAAGKPSAAQAG